MTNAEQPEPLTEIRNRVSEARALIATNLNALVGPVELDYDFYREWNGCWKARVDIKSPVRGQLDFTLLGTPSGALLALPRPLPERWRTETGISDSNGNLWSLDGTGALVAFTPPV